MNLLNLREAQNCLEKQQSLKQPSRTSSQVSSQQITCDKSHQLKQDCLSKVPEVSKTCQLNKRNFDDPDKLYDFLQGNSISQLNRAILRLKIYEYCHLKSFSVRTAALSSLILDLFISKKKNQKSQEFKSLCMSCIGIANKLEDRLYNKINPEFFNVQEVVYKEAEVCFQLNFDLYKITYVDIAKVLVNSWEQFKNMINLSVDSEFNEIKQKISFNKFNYGLLFEFLQFCFLIIQSYKFTLQSLVFNSFYLIFCIQNDQILSKNITTSKIKKLYQPPNPFYSILFKFFDQLNISTDIFKIEDIEVSIGMYLYPLYNDLIYFNSNHSNKCKIFHSPHNISDLQSFEQFKLITCYFPNKNKSFKRYMKRKQSQTTK